jgi:hypothetical protein
VRKAAGRSWRYVNRIISDLYDNRSRNVPLADIDALSHQVAKTKTRVAQLSLVRFHTNQDPPRALDPLSISGRQALKAFLACCSVRALPSNVFDFWSHLASGVLYRRNPCRFSFPSFFLTYELVYFI